MGKKKSGESFYQLHHQAMEAKILRISKRLLLKRGFAMLGMDEIASKVGLSRQRLYCYFRGIDPIIYEIQIADMNEFITAMKEAYLALSTLPPEQRTPIDDRCRLCLPEHSAGRFPFYQRL
jgi:AcrR family transcriptional regulator